MLNLLLETSTERALVGIAEGERILAEYAFEPGYDSSKRLLPVMQSLLRDLGLTPVQFQLVTTGVGPGSYTGIRVAVIVAKSLSLALGIPLVGIPSLSCFVPETSLPFAVLIDAKIGGVYALIGVTPPRLMSIAEAERVLADVQVIVTPNAAPLRRRFQGGGGQWIWQERGPSAQEMAKRAYASYQKGEYSTDFQLEILYLRLTQAEIERLGK